MEDGLREEQFWVSQRTIISRARVHMVFVFRFGWVFVERSTTRQFIFFRCMNSFGAMGGRGWLGVMVDPSFLPLFFP